MQCFRIQIFAAQAQGLTIVVMYMETVDDFCFTFLLGLESE